MSESIIQVHENPLIDSYNSVLPIVFPIAGESYRLRNNWHVKRSKKRCSFDHSFNDVYRAHNGVDIGSKLGTPVYSCVKGVIIEAPFDDFPLDRYGNNIWIQSTQEDLTFGYRFLYAHLDEVCVEVGDQVDTTIRIGTLGMTGNAIRPHIHFEIHYSSEHKFYCNKCKPNHHIVTAINPYPSLYKAKERLTTEADLVTERRWITITTVGRTIKQIFNRYKPRI
jgi:murein DD-endopeptidase MepM/ murein hydrolase activator NlpD